METSASSSLDKLQTYHCPRNKQKQTTDNREKKKKLENISEYSNGAK